MADTIGSMPGRDFTTGTRVDVRSRYVGSWSRGFEVAEHVRDGGYKVRRLSDGSVLPDLFGEEELRPERRRNEFWGR